MCQQEEYNGTILKYNLISCVLTRQLVLSANFSKPIVLLRHIQICFVSRKQRVKIVSLFVFPQLVFEWILRTIILVKFHNSHTNNTHVFNQTKKSGHRQFECLLFFVCLNYVLVIAMMVIAEERNKT